MSWSSWFRINSRMVARLKVGRLLLGGDSAHIHSPAGAQGMNTGIQDMINQGWKLALVLKGQAPSRCSTRTSIERLPVIRDVLAKTEGMTNVIGSGNVGPWSQEAEMAQDTIGTRMCQLAIGYRDSPLSATHLQEGLHAGDRVPDLPVRYRSEGGANWLAWKDTVQLARSIPVHAAGGAFRRVGSGPCRSVRCCAARAPSQWRGRAGTRARSGPRALPGSFRPIGRRFPWCARDGYVGFASGEHARTRASLMRIAARG